MLGRRCWWLMCGISVLGVACPARAQLAEPNGLPIPQPPSTYETSMVTSRKRNTTEYFSASDVTLQGLFAARGEDIDPITDAGVGPSTFSPLCGFTGTLVMRGGACKVDFGWYNVTASDQIPTDSEIYTLIPKEDKSVFECRVLVQEPYTYFTYQDFCPLAYHNLPEVQAETPLVTFSANQIRSDPRYLGGQIGFALRGSGSPCSQTKYSEPELNTICTNCSPVAAWITTLIYASTVDANGYYLAFEDLPMEATSFNDNDGDFNDFVFFVTGVACTGAGEPCDSGLQGACAIGRTDCATPGMAPACHPAVKPSDEKCDNIDNDCNGVVDDGDGLCPAGQVCSRGTCVSACGTGEFRCPEAGFVCQNGFCIEEACAGVACEPGQVCSSGVCSGGCEGVVCPTHQKCQLGRCVDPCAGVSCDGGQVCESGLCLESCSCRNCEEGKTCAADGRCLESGCENVDCADGQVCVAGACVDACAGAACPGGGGCLTGQCLDPVAASAGSGGSISVGAGGSIVIGAGGSPDATSGGATHATAGSNTRNAPSTGAGCMCCLTSSGSSSSSWALAVACSLFSALRRRRHRPQS